MTLRSHFVVAHKSYPRSEVFEYLIDKTTDAAHGHWYWDGDFHIDPPERTPIFVWTPQPELKMCGKYIVARLLWVEANPGTYKHLILKNTCGVHACVNPAHWENPHRERWWVLPPDVEASLVVGLSPHGPRVHIRSEDSVYMMCGNTLRNSEPHTVPAHERRVITCTECVEAWRGFGRPLVEVERPTDAPVKDEIE